MCILQLVMYRPATLLWSKYYRHSHIYAKLETKQHTGSTDVFVFVYSDGDIYDDIGDGTFWIHCCAAELLGV